MILNIFLPCFDDGCGKFQVEIATSRPWGGDSLPEFTPCQNAATTAKGSATTHIRFLSAIATLQKMLHLGIWSWQCSPHTAESCNSHGAHHSLGIKIISRPRREFSLQISVIGEFYTEQNCSHPGFLHSKTWKKTFIFFNNHVFCGRWEWSPVIKISCHVWRLSFWTMICCELQCFQESPLFKVIYRMKNHRPGCHSTPGLHFFKRIPTQTFICHCCRVGGW